MTHTIKNKAIIHRKNKISFLYLTILVIMSIFLISVFKTIHSHRHLPSQTVILHDRALRGKIISHDGYTISASKKTYKAIIRAESIIPEKRQLFIKLFSIYSAIPEKEILAKFIDKQGKKIRRNIILSKDINARAAMQLRSLSYKLRKLHVFRAIKNRHGIEVVYGLDIVENGEKRLFPLHDVMSPILGYVAQNNHKKYTRPIGKKGLERAYEKYLTSQKNGFLKGKRDVVSALIHDKDTIYHPRIDGMNLHLNIALSLQRRIELMADEMKKNIDADEILVGVMESNTGKIRALASTRRYDPSHILQKDIPALVPNFTEYPYEAGSVLKPLTIGIALDKQRITPHTWFKTGYKNFNITANQTINDDDFIESQDVTDIIVHSSNIGTSQIVWRLTGKEYRDGLLKFGIAQKTGIDLSRELPGFLKSVHLLNNKMHRANSSFGYGMTVTFMQLMKAYSAFNNHGLAMTPTLLNYLEDANKKHYTLAPKVGNSQAISPKAAKQIHNILLEVVKRGTGIKAQYSGLEVGGKTGTAHIAVHGRYVQEYHSSFYGFANDKQGHKYTIGVLVIRAKKHHKYFASQSAVPTFRHVLDILVELNYLNPERGIKHAPTVEYQPSTISTPLIKPAISVKQTSTLSPAPKPIPHKPWTSHSIQKPKSQTKKEKKIKHLDVTDMF